MKIRAPAKINLNLRVVGKRRDGYHLIDTIMAPVSLYDEIVITTGRLVRNASVDFDTIIVTSDHPKVPTGEKNLAYRAARLLVDERKIRRRVRIHIKKRIPIGAGLGGGSSDAAAVLVGLNRLLRLNHTSAELERISLSLGVDVPFFIRAVPARARGIGERLTRIPRFPRLWLIILYPGFPVSTTWVYRNLSVKLTKLRLNNSINSLLGNPDQIRRLLVNDLEAVTANRYRKIHSLKQDLSDAGALGVLMSGSGSSVFGVFKSRQRAQQTFYRLKQEEEGTQAFLAEVLRRPRRYKPGK